MGAKGKKRREKNYLKSHGGDNRLPPPPKPSSIDALPSKLRQLMSLTSSSLGSDANVENSTKSKKKDASLNKPHSVTEHESKSTGARDEGDKGSAVSEVANEGKADMKKNVKEDDKQKKRKRKEVNDLRFDAEMEKLGVKLSRKQRKKDHLKAKKLKKKKGKSELNLDLPKRDEVKFGEVVQAPPKLSILPKAPKKRVDPSQERLRLQAIEAYRNRRGWTNRPGIQLPSLDTSSELQ